MATIGCYSVGMAKTGKLEDSMLDAVNLFFYTQRVAAIPSSHEVVFFSWVNLQGVMLYSTKSVILRLHTTYKV